MIRRWIRLGLMPPRGASLAAHQEMVHFGSWLCNGLQRVRDHVRLNPEGDGDLMRVVASLPPAIPGSPEGLAAMHELRRQAGEPLSS